MKPQEVADILGLQVNRSKGAPHEWWYRILFNVIDDMYAFIDLCTETSDKPVTSVVFLSRQGVAEWWDNE